MMYLVLQLAPQALVSVCPTVLKKSLSEIDLKQNRFYLNTDKQLDCFPVENHIPIRVSKN